MNFTLKPKIFKPKEAKHHLKKLQKILRHRHHPLIHKIHYVHGISKKTLFYVKEYGLQSNIPKKILKESLKIIMFASVISSFGGLALEQIKEIFLSIIPLVILLPTINDMVGDYGTIAAARFSTMLHKREIKKKWWKEEQVRVLFYQIMITAIITALLSAALSLGISTYFKASVPMTIMFAAKILLITLIDIIVLVSILFITTVNAGIYYYRKKEDPNNFLIPITTSIADFGTMLVLAGLVLFFF